MPIKKKLLSNTVHFSITGEFVTQMARTWVMEGDYKRALKMLTGDLPGFTYEMAVDLLTGRSKLVGVDDLYLEEDDPSKCEEYLKQVGYLYDGRWSYRGTTYVPRSKVTNYGPHDGATVLSDTPYRAFIESHGLYPAGVKVPDGAYWERAKNYCEAPEDVAVFVCVDPTKPLASSSFVIWKVAKEAPPWLTEHSCVNEAFAAYTQQHRVRETGHLEVYGKPLHTSCYKTTQTSAGLEDVSEVLAEGLPSKVLEEMRDDLRGETDEECEDRLGAAITARALRWQAAIKQQAAGNFVEKEWNGTTYQIPKVPLERWCLAMIQRGYDAHGSDKVLKMPEWTNVCPPGLKMLMDNQDHSDWLVGAGFCLEQDYARNSKFRQWMDDLLFSYQEEIYGFEVAVFVGKGMGFGITKQADDPTLGPGDVLVVPNAGPQYQLAAQLVCKEPMGFVICEVGGPLAHLVTVGKELGIKLIRVKDAMRVLQPSCLVEADFDKGKFRIVANV